MCGGLTGKPTTGQPLTHDPPPNGFNVSNSQSPYYWSVSDESERDPSDAKSRIKSRMTPDPITRVTDLIVEKIAKLIDDYEDFRGPGTYDEPEPLITPLGLGQTKRNTEKNRMQSIDELRRIAIEDPELPSVTTPMILRQGEVGHLGVQRAVWRELRGS